MDALGMGLCVAFIAFVRLPSLKVSTLLLSGLLLYDVFWVFFSQYVFSTNVMVKVIKGGWKCLGIVLTQSRLLCDWKIYMYIYFDVLLRAWKKDFIKINGK